MTIIIATSWGGRAAIASDSAGTDGWGAQKCHGSKLKKYPFGFLGFSGSYAAVPWLDNTFRKCKRLETTRQAWALAKACRQELIDGGWKNEGGKTLPNLEDLHILLLSNGGKIWTLQCDFAILRSKDWAAVGSGYLTAMGAAEAFRRIRMPADRAAKICAKIAIDNVSSCGGRVHVKAVEKERWLPRGGR